MPHNYPGNRRCILGLKTVFAAALAAVLAYFLFSGWQVLAADGSAREVLPSTTLELRIEAEKAEYEIGEKPAITATLFNRSGRDLHLVRPLDGSERGRSPVAKFAVEPPSDALPLEQILMCGNMDPIDSNDFVLVPDGGSLDLMSWVGFELGRQLDRGPGDYRIRMTYATDATDPGKWIGGPMSALGKKKAILSVTPYLLRVPRVSVESNELLLRFTSPYSEPVQALREGSLADAKRAVRQVAALEPAQLSETHTAAIVQALARHYDANNAHYINLAGLALPILAASATAEDADAFWEMLERERQFCERRVYFDSSWTLGTKMGVQVLETILRSGPQTREERLHYVFQVHEYQDEHRSQRLEPVRPFRMNFIELARTPGEDIDRVLAHLLEQSSHFGGLESEEGQFLTRALSARSSSQGTR